uniref:F-box domain-containing protein n=1 Tax=Percolomonas cosmopolitus TaxID=63605 RepID=A0A7S1KTY9_9EUKA
MSSSPEISPLLSNELLSIIASYLPLPSLLSIFGTLSKASYKYLVHYSEISPKIDVLLWDGPHYSTYGCFLRTMQMRLQHSQMMAIYARVLEGAAAAAVRDSAVVCSSPEISSPNDTWCDQQENAELRKKGQQHSGPLKGLLVRRLSIYDSHRGNELLHRFAPRISPHLEILSISWNHAFRLHLSNPVHSAEIEWFGRFVPRLEVFVQRHSFQTTRMVPFWQSVREHMENLQHLCLRLSFEKCNTLGDFVSETEEWVLENVTELSIYPRKNCYEQLRHFRRLRVLRLPTCYRDRPNRFESSQAKFDMVKREPGEVLFCDREDSSTESTPHSHIDLDLILEVTHPWPFKLYELAEYLHIFPQVDRFRFRLSYLSAVKSLPVPSMARLKEILLHFVPSPSVLCELLEQLEMIKTRYLEHEERMHGEMVCFVKQQHIQEKSFGSSCSSSYAGDNMVLEWSDSSAECFRRMVCFVRRQNRIESVWPCLVQYFSTSFNCNVLLDECADELPGSGGHVVNQKQLEGPPGQGLLSCSVS